MRFLLFTFLVVLVCGCAGTDGGVKFDLTGKRVVMVVAPKDFRDEEFFTPRKFFEEAGADVVVASQIKGEPLKGMLGGAVKASITIGEIKVDELDALVLVGGSGAQVYWENEELHKVLKGAYEAGKVVAAICISPVTLANAGLLKGKEATVWASEKERLTACGAEYSDADVVVSGRIVTANGPDAASAFAEAVASLLLGK